MRSRIDDLTWRNVRQDWIGTIEPVADIARRHGISRSAIDRRASAEKWPPRSSGIDDPLAIATALYRDLTHELRQSLQSLRAAEDADLPASAQRGTLIRNHRRALFVLIEARKGLADQAGTGSGVPLDLEAAKQDILERLARLYPVSLPDDIASKGREGQPGMS